jgi:hypothetical protein
VTWTPDRTLLHRYRLTEDFGRDDGSHQCRATTEHTTNRRGSNAPGHRQRQRSRRRRRRGSRRRYKRRHRVDLHRRRRRRRNLHRGPYRRRRRLHGLDALHLCGARCARSPDVSAHAGDHRDRDDDDPNDSADIVHRLSRRLRRRRLHRVGRRAAFDACADRIAHARIGLQILQAIVVHNTEVAALERVGDR